MSRTGPLGIAAQTLALPPAGMIEVAAGAGFEMVGLKFNADWTDALVADLRRRLDGEGVALLDVEAVRLLPEMDWESTGRLIEAAGSLGARAVLVTGQDPEPSRAAESYRRVCELAGAAGLRAALEPMPFRDTATLADALALIAELGHPAAALLPDNHHLSNAGDTPADLARVDPALIAYAQICDAPAEPSGRTREALMQDALIRRVLPGDGALPIADFLVALPPGTPVSVEILSSELRASYPSPLAYARAIRRAAAETTTDHRHSA